MNPLEYLPLVSIITPVYNGSQYIEELILSVKTQNYPRVEHIIIDDGSQDGGATVAILTRYPHLKWRSRDNRGQYATMNEGLEIARGDIICFISADDLLCSDAVQNAVDYLAGSSSSDGVFGRTLLILENGRKNDFQTPFPGWPFKYYPYLSHVSHCSLYIRTKVIRTRSLFFDERYRYTGDYEWMTRMVLAGLKVGNIDRNLSMVRMHGTQATQQHRAQMLFERDTIIKHYHFYNWKYHFLAFLYFLNIAFQKIRASYENNGIKGGFKLVSDWALRRMGGK